jgi:putative endonuclease
MRTYYVYIMTNERNTVFYTGVTGNLKARIYQHKYGLVEGFTKKYNLKKFVYAEETNNVFDAIEREKKLKKWKKQWKIDLIKKSNAGMEDLYSSLA